MFGLFLMTGQVEAEAQVQTLGVPSSSPGIPGFPGFPGSLVPSMDFRLSRMP